MRFVKSIGVLFAIAAMVATVSAVPLRMVAKDSKFKVADAPSVSEQVLNSFFAVALDSLTSSSDGYTPVLNPANYFVQIQRTGNPVDLAVFNSTTAFYNPTIPDLPQAEHFVEMVNKNNVVGNIEGKYWDIVRAAGTLNDTDPTRRPDYVAACNYLYSDGTSQLHPSPIYQQYKNLKNVYTNALVTYRSKQATLSALDWYINAPIYGEALNNAQQDFNAVATGVEDALNTIATAGSSLSATMFVNARALFQTTSVASVIKGESFTTSELGVGAFHVVFAQPPDWATNENAYTSVVLSSANSQSTISDSYTSWQTSGGFFGFFSYSAGGSTRTHEYHAEATDVTLSVEYVLVQLDRPWLDDSIFSASSWSLQGAAAGSVSNGQPNQATGTLPSYTSHILVAKNLTLQATWTQNDNSYISRQLSGGGGFGFGCFSLAGGSYQSGSSQSTQQAQFENSVIRAPGAQIIGYVQKIVPFSPPISN